MSDSPSFVIASSGSALIPLGAPRPAAPPPPERVPVVETRPTDMEAPVPFRPTEPGTLQRQLDATLAGSDTQLAFRVDQASNRMVVSVLDRGGALIAQFPDSTSLAIAAQYRDTGHLLKATA